MSRRSEIALRMALWFLLGGWLGALVLFAAVVAPAAFEVLGREAAGRLVGRVLPALEVYGAAAGVVLAGLALLLGRGPAAQILPLALAALGLLSLFGIAPRIEEVRGLAFGPEADPAARALFARLHLYSVLLYAAVAVGALVLIGLHAAADVRKKSSDSP